MVLNILVTGGTGLVGSSLNDIKNLPDIKWLFLSSKMCDLRSQLDVNDLFISFKPDIVIHLAARVGGLFMNIENNYLMMSDNLKINNNILDYCKKYKVKRLINILSTCIFPDNNVTYPLTSDQILNGPPHFSNEGYAYSKRLLYMGSKLLSNETDIEIVNLIVTNLYGKNDNYNLINSHVIPGIVHKCHLALKSNNNLFVKGNGKAKRQFLYSKDLAKIILEFINLSLPKKFNTLIVSPPSQNEITISKLVSCITDAFDFENLIIYENKYKNNGQDLKTCDNTELLQYLPNFKFTSLDNGLKETITYFLYNYYRIKK
jgi:GDP-L-fucose synthase